MCKQDNILNLCLNALATICPEIVGGSADLTPSNLTKLTMGIFSIYTTPMGRTLRFGVPVFVAANGIFARLETILRHVFNFIGYRALYDCRRCPTAFCIFATHVLFSRRMVLRISRLKYLASASGDATTLRFSVRPMGMVLRGVSGIQWNVLPSVLALTRQK
jgi:hypothetical protein